MLHLLPVDFQPLNTRDLQPIHNQLYLQLRVYSPGLSLRHLLLKLVLLDLQPLNTRDLQPIHNQLHL